MNHRVLELLKTPKTIQSEDLHLLKEEINSFPYIQNIRALYLYGVHLYDKENYQKVLSTTAAYTTDKKILYQLINGKIQQKPKAEVPVEMVKEKIIPTENPLQLLLRSKASVFPLKREEETSVEEKPESVEAEAETLPEAESSFGIPPAPKPEVKEVFVKGERNRILFEGEENFLEDENVEVIDLEATLESGSIITQKLDKKEEVQEEDTDNSHKKDPEIVETDNFTPETIIEEEKITSESEKEEILDISALSFQETESFLPEIEVSANETEETYEIKNEETDEDDNSSLNKTEETADFTPETIINEDRISSSEEEKPLHDDAELSFHGMESFLPEVKIQPNHTEEKVTEISQSNFSKHEDEMRRLIEEVEKKMKEKAASETSKKEEEPENEGHDISFSATQSFEIKPEEPKSEQVTGESIAEKNVEPEASEKAVEEISENSSETVTEDSPEVNAAWKPMSFESNLPDSLLSKSSEASPSIPQIPAETATEVVYKEAVEVKPEPNISDEAISESEEEQITESIEDQSENVRKEESVPEVGESKEVPVMNVSFFGSGWTIPKPEKQQENNTEQPKEDIKQKNEVTPSVENTAENKKSDSLDSNIPGFINTWQSWLKIDRSEEAPKEKTEIKKKVIEAFIENNPKISQLKEESSFIVKEKGDDISHLMTETLATLYFEQKLYTKAIKAFEILIKKTPEKKEYYENRIQEIKDFRTKG
ncbi:hypothetical protein [Chryseobacterium cheonjiense]|uniref:Uncharacterized protein n=1 Tax=Chryseobacterium cheonjiense TaxID=2728845 RepID=A0A7Y0A7K2_9FLAO|nr:hypothetical protein [Chryseobacterium cheonjiense]NML58173.1 hypothetical protein [Chryseobacterium cheonjiense]